MTLRQILAEATVIAIVFGAAAAVLLHALGRLS